MIRRTRQGEVDIRAEVIRDGVRHRGMTYTFAHVAGHVQSVNIVVAPEHESATLRGYVFDRQGRALNNAWVFAYSGAGSSQRAFTNEDGLYELNWLIANMEYTISAGGLGLRSDQETIVLSAGETARLDFTTGNPGLPTLTPPSNLFATSWVAPAPTRGDRAVDLTVVRELVGTRDGSPATASSRTTRSVRSDMIVEVDLEWDEQRFSDLVGWGIYRAPSATGPLTGVDFFPEPLAAFYVDIGINPNSVYSYAVTTISALYPDHPDRTESDLSNRAVIETLGLLRASAIAMANPRFSWNADSGADVYRVFLFDEFPGIGVTSVWNTPHLVGTNVTYNGPSLEVGRTYYYFVVGFGDYVPEEDFYQARTVSAVGSFRR